LLPGATDSEKQVVKLEHAVTRLSSKSLGKASGRQLFFKDLSDCAADVGQA
jgi:hypothetical protein